MKVKDLLQQLKKCDPDTEVMTGCEVNLDYLSELDCGFRIMELADGRKVVALNYSKHSNSYEVRP